MMENLDTVDRQCWRRCYVIVSPRGQECISQFQMGLTIARLPLEGIVRFRRWIQNKNRMDLTMLSYFRRLHMTMMTLFYSRCRPDG